MHGDKMVNSFQKQIFSTWKSREKILIACVSLHLFLVLGTRGQKSQGVIICMYH